MLVVLGFMLHGDVGIGGDGEAFAGDLDSEGFVLLSGIGDASQGLDELFFGNFFFYVSVCHGVGVRFSVTRGLREAPEAQPSKRALWLGKKEPTLLVK